MRLLSSLCCVLVVCGVAPGQEITDAVERLRDVASREAAASELVLAGPEAGSAIGRALRAACAEGRHAEVDCLLTVLARRDLDAGGAYGDVLELMPEFAPRSAAQAFHTLLSVVPADVEGLTARLEAYLNGLDGRLPSSDVGTIMAGYRDVSSTLWMFERMPALSIGRLRTQVDQAADGSALVALGLVEAREDDAAALLELCARRFLFLAPRSVDRTSASGFSAEAAFLRRLARIVLRLDPRGEAAAVAHAYRLHSEPLRPLRLHAARELVALGPAARPALPLLVSHLRWYAAEADLTKVVLNAIAAIGREAEQALPLVRELSDAEDPSVASAARLALRRIAPAKAGR